MIFPVVAPVIFTLLFVFPSTHAPLPVTVQLADGGRLVAPVGPEGRQELLRFTRRGEQLHRERLGFVSFVPLLAGKV